MLICSKTRILSIVLSLALVLGVTGIFPVSAAGPDALGTSYDLGLSGPITIGASDGDFTITGTYTGADTAITVTSGYTGTITLDNVTIDVTEASQNAIHITDSNISDHLTINLVGTNVINTSRNSGGAAIRHIGQGALTVTGNELRIDGTYGIRKANVPAAATVVLEADQLVIDVVMYGIYAPSGITVNSGSIDITSNTYAIFWWEPFVNVINGGTLDIYGYLSAYRRRDSNNNDNKQFDSLTPAHTLTVAAGEGGTATIRNVGATGAYQQYEQVDLVATPAPGYEFIEWITSFDGDYTGCYQGSYGSPLSSETSFEMASRDTTVTATFRDLTAPPVVPVSSITVNSGADSITTKGGTLQMSAAVLPANATNKDVDWTVSGTAATINSTGLLTATSNGTMMVRATATDGSGVYGEKAITISGQDTTTPTVPVSSITVNSSTNSITTKGGTLQMSADVQPANASNKAVTWTVSGTGATIDSKGLLSATANGTVTVRATAADGSGKYGEEVITISGQDTTTPTVPVTAITVNSNADSITTKGGTLQMSADVQPTNATNKAVSWTVSGSAATIDSNGLLTATANGTVTVRATAMDGSGVYGEKAIAISGQTSGGGGSSDNGSKGGSGSSSGGSSKPDSTTTTGWTAAPETEWVNTPNAGGRPSRSSRKAGVKAGGWKKLTSATYTHDTMDGNSVQLRIIISNPSQWKQETMLSGYVKGQSVDSIRSIFGKWFSNSVRVICFDQQADWEQTVSVAAKVDLTGLDTNNLVFYSYTRDKNIYRRIASPNYSIDANGYLRFVTPYAGSIVISDGVLDKK